MGIGYQVGVAVLLSSGGGASVRSPRKLRAMAATSVEGMDGDSEGASDCVRDVPIEVVALKMLDEMDIASSSRPAAVTGPSERRFWEK